MKKLANIRTVCMAILLVLFQCKNSSQAEMEIMKNETECIALTQKLRLFDMRAVPAGPTEREVEEMLVVEANRAKSISELRALRNSLFADIHVLEQDFIDLKKQVIAHKRSSAMGRKMAVFETKTRAYKEITIQSVTAAGLEVKHSSGTSRITPMQLSEAQLDEYGLSLETARDALAVEEKLQRNYIATVDREVAKQKAEERSRVAAVEASRMASQKAEATVAAYRAPAQQSTLSLTPPTRTYRVRSRPQSFFYYYNPGYYNGSCRHSYRPERVEAAPITRVPRTPYLPTP